MHYVSLIAASEVALTSGWCTRDESTLLQERDACCVGCAVSARECKETRPSRGQSREQRAAVGLSPFCAHMCTCAQVRTFPLTPKVTGLERSRNQRRQSGTAARA